MYFVRDFKYKDEIVFIFSYLIFLYFSLDFITKPFWFDEIHTQFIWRYNFSDIYSNLVKGDVHLPIYFYLHKLWINLFSSRLEIQRILPMVLNGLIAYIIFKYISFKINLIFGFLFLVLLFNSIAFVMFSFEIRPHVLLSLLSLISIYFFVNIEKPRYPVYLAFSSTLLIYTHYLSIVVFTIFTLFTLLNNKNYKKVMCSLLFPLLAFLLNFKNIFEQFGHRSRMAWVNDVTIKDYFHSYLTSLYPVDQPIQYLLLICVCLGILFYHRNQRKPSLSFILIGFYSYIVLFFSFFLLGQKLFVLRYHILFSYFSFFFLVYFFYQLSRYRKIMKYVIIVGISSIIYLSDAASTYDKRDWSWRVDWKQLASEVKELKEQYDYRFYTEPEWVKGPYLFYLDDRYKEITDFKYKGQDIKKGIYVYFKSFSKHKPPPDAKEVKHYNGVSIYIY